MPVFLKQTAIGKRAELVSQSEIDKMLKAGTAVRCAGYEIYEEVTADEVDQGYMTRNMEALPAAARRRTPKPTVPADK